MPAGGVTVDATIANLFLYLEAGFRKVVLVLLLVSGVALVAPVITPWFSM